MIRSKRSRSVAISPTCVPLAATGTSPNPKRWQSRRRKSVRSTDSRRKEPVPESSLDSSSKSITILSKRLIWVAITSSACWLRSDSSLRRATSTSTAALSAVIGERNSWLTSLAKRTSRSMRSWRVSAISLKVTARRLRSGSFSGSSRASRRPLAMSLAASATRPTGRRRRREVNQPSAMAVAVATMRPARSALRIDPRVRSVSRSEKTSKYSAPTAGMGTPTASYRTLSWEKRCAPDFPVETSMSRCVGRSSWVKRSGSLA